MQILHKTYVRSLFLFKDEVGDTIAKLYDDIHETTRIKFRLQNMPLLSGNRPAIESRLDEVTTRIDGSNEVMRQVFRPYLAMKQREPRSLRQWFQEANARRLSYGDEKQR